MLFSLSRIIWATWILNGSISWRLTLSLITYNLCINLSPSLWCLLVHLSIRYFFWSTWASLLNGWTMNIWLRYYWGLIIDFIIRRANSSSWIRLSPSIIEESNLINFVYSCVDISSIQILSLRHRLTLRTDTLLSLSIFLVVLRSHITLINLCHSFINILKILLLQLCIQLTGKLGISITNITMVS
jgi:hypothetical protein